MPFLVFNGIISTTSFLREKRLSFFSTKSSSSFDIDTITPDLFVEITFPIFGFFCSANTNDPVLISFKRPSALNSFKASKTIILLPSFLIDSFFEICL